MSGTAQSTVDNQFAMLDALEELIAKAADGYQLTPEDWRLVHACNKDAHDFEHLTKRRQRVMHHQEIAGSAKQRAADKKKLLKMEADNRAESEKLTTEISERQQRLRDIENQHRQLAEKVKRSETSVEMLRDARPDRTFLPVHVFSAYQNRKQHLRQSDAYQRFLELPTKIEFCKTVINTNWNSSDGGRSTRIVQMANSAPHNHPARPVSIERTPTVSQAGFAQWQSEKQAELAAYEKELEKLRPIIEKEEAELEAIRDYYVS